MPMARADRPQLTVDERVPYSESEVLQAFGQARQELIAGTSSRDECECGGRTGKITACELDASSIARLVCEGAGGRS
jgi:hypothetical protein